MKKESQLSTALRLKSGEGRIQLIDALRGLSILLMVFYHFGYDLVSFLGVSRTLLDNPVLDVLQPFFAGVFIFLSGTSCRFSKNNLRRGVQIFAAGMAVTAVTYVMSQPAWFGILHFLGVAAVLFSWLGRYLDKIPEKAAPFLYLALFILTKVLIADRIFDVRGLFALGIRDAAFRSSDYFPILPWIFVYFAGTWFGRFVVERRLPDWFYSFKSPFFAACGRMTIWIYLLHQPVLYGIILLIGYFRGLT